MNRPFKLKVTEIPKDNPLGIVKLARPAGDVAVYANHCNINLSPEDCTLDFGQKDPEGEYTGVSVVRVICTVEHAKRLVTALTQAIASYEETFGEVKENVIDRLLPEARAEVEEQAKAIAASTKRARNG